MRGFARRTTVEAAWRWLDSQLAPLPAERVPLMQCAGRILAESIISRVNVPGFTRSMMDGYALQAADTASAGSYNRLPLRIVGQALPGQPFVGEVAAGNAVRIMTGAPLPAGADAVLPVEATELEGETLLCLDQVPPDKNISRPGEDVAAGDEVLEGGRMLRPQDLGVLASIGYDTLPVIRRPRVRLVITGNELLPAGSLPREYQVVDANGPMLAALVSRDGGLIDFPGILADEPTAILAAMRSDADVILVSGGSSVGQEDHAPLLLAAHGELPIHGLAMRPSSPAGMGRLGERLVFLLPGNPVSCLCAYDFFAGRAIRGLGGRKLGWPYRPMRLPLARKIVSTVGRVDYCRVRIVNDRIEPLAISGASLLSSTTRADGFVVVPADDEGYAENTEVQVWLYDL